MPYSPLGRGFLTGKLKQVEDLAKFNLAVPAGGTAGDRYPAASMAYLSR